MAFFVQLFHFGATAQSERVKLISAKDSLSFALGVEHLLGLIYENSKFEALDRKLLVEGFEANLNESPVHDCEELLRKFLGLHGSDFNTEFLSEGSFCLGRMCAYYFYVQMSELGQLNVLNLDMVKKGFRSQAFDKDQEILNTMQCVGIMRRFSEKIEEDFFTQIEEKDQLFWAEVLSNPTVEQIEETGIFFETIKKGTGGKPSESSDIEVNYILTNALGDTLENSWERSPLKINLGQVIDGWREGFPALEKGGTYRLFVPYEKAYKYGNRQAPQGALCFYIEFIDFGNQGSIFKPIRKK